MKDWEKSLLKEKEKANACDVIYHMHSRVFEYTRKENLLKKTIDFIFFLSEELKKHKVVGIEFIKVIGKDFPEECLDFIVDFKIQNNERIKFLNVPEHLKSSILDSFKRCNDLYKKMEKESEKYNQKREIVKIMGKKLLDVMKGMPVETDEGLILQSDMFRIIDISFCKIDPEKKYIIEIYEEVEDKKEDV